jgi:hypothetical protein
LIATLRAQLAAAEDRERWLRERIEQLEQTQRALLPAPRQSWADKLASAIERWRRK